MEQFLIPSQLTGFQQARLNRDVLCCLFRTLGQAAYAVPDFQSDIPQQSHPLLKPAGNGIIELSRITFCCGKQYEQVDIGIREKLAAPIPAHCQQNKGMVHSHSLPDLAKDVVNDVGVAQEKSGPVAVFPVVLAQLLARSTQTILDGLGI